MSCYAPPIFPFHRLKSSTCPYFPVHAARRRGSMAETPPPASNPQMRIGARTGSRRACGDTNKRAASSSTGGVSCEMPFCNKNPSFAYMGEKRRRFCKRHAEPGMVNAYFKYCDVDQCRERATFESGEGKVQRCLAHRESGMVPRSKICQVEGGGCARQSSYGPEGGRPVFCTTHKLPGMVQVGPGFELEDYSRIVARNKVPPFVRLTAGLDLFS